MPKARWPLASWYGRGSWTEGGWYGTRLGTQQPGTAPQPRMRFVDLTPSAWSDGSAMRWVA